MAIILLMSMIGETVLAQTDLSLFAKGKSRFSIYVKEKDAINERAAHIIQDYFKRATSWQLPIVYEGSARNRVISVSVSDSDFDRDAYEIRTDGNNVYITGGKKGLIYGAYRFIEDFLGARKWYVGKEGTYVPTLDQVSVPKGISIQSQPRFSYREVYFPVELDREYMDWHGLHDLEELWGLWGHSFNKLLPASVYFEQYPEYYSYYQGKRQPNQLCLSNDDVYRLIVDRFSEMISANPTAEYWSLSPNDELGYCECDQCQKLDEREGGPQGSLIHFVNRVAENFPDKKFTTLAYTYSANPPLHQSVRTNVYVMLSSIDARRTFPLSEDPNAAAFRSQLIRWKEKAEHVFVWDYYTQFTNYMAPFPQIGTIAENISYFDKKDVDGVFAQGSGSTYSYMAELKSYLLAKLLWNPALDEKELTEEFVRGFYGAAADDILNYLELIRENLLSEKVRLDIYGNPIDNHRDFLSPEAMDRYSTLFDRAEAKVESNEILLKRVRKIRLAYEYVYFQQAKFYGLEPHGIYHWEEETWKVRPGFKDKLDNFLLSMQETDIHELSEGGTGVEEYGQGWREIFDAGVRSNKAVQGEVYLQYPYVEDFPAKGIRTLHDRVPGYLDFSYNWLVFNDTPFEATVVFDNPITVDSIEVNFLEDPRHWFFRPSFISMQVSVDGVHFEEAYRKDEKLPEEDYAKYIIPYKHQFSGQKIKAIRIIAHAFEELPDWRFHPRKKPSIAIDEIWVD